MSLCEFCNKEAKVVYICPQCGNRFCQDHRKPEDHECNVFQDIIEHSEEITTSPSPLLDSGISDDVSEEKKASPAPTMDSRNDDNMPENDEKEFINIEEILFTEKQIPSSPSSLKDILMKSRELFAQLDTLKIPIAILIIVSVLSGALMGVLISPNDSTDTIQQRYDALYTYYIDLQAINQDLNLQVENTNQQINSLQNEFETLNQEYTAMQTDWDTIFSDQTQYRIPSINKLENWLAVDLTDQQVISDTYSPMDQAIVLSLKAKKQQIRLGVIIIRGNFSEEFTEYTYNVVETENGVNVYIDPSSDEIWWIAGNEEISPNKIWKIGEYSSVYVTEIIMIKKQ